MKTWKKTARQRRRRRSVLTEVMLCPRCPGGGRPFLGSIRRGVERKCSDCRTPVIYRKKRFNRAAY